jgi:hypothetical protein
MVRTGPRKPDPPVSITAGVPSRVPIRVGGTSENPRRRGMGAQPWLRHTLLRSRKKALPLERERRANARNRTTPGGGSRGPIAVPMLCALATLNPVGVREPRIPWLSCHLLTWVTKRLRFRDRAVGKALGPTDPLGGPCSVVKPTLVARTVLVRSGQGCTTPSCQRARWPDRIDFPPIFSEGGFLCVASCHFSRCS